MTENERDQILRRTDETLLRLLIVNTALLGLQVATHQGTPMMPQSHRAELNEILTSTSAYLSQHEGISQNQGGSDP